MNSIKIQGSSVPAIGLGTWDLRGEACVESVQHALQIGYRHIDTAQGYDNEAEVGRGLAASGVARKDVFLTTKVRPENFTRDRVYKSTAESLRKLGTDYVDLLLMHWPNPDVPLEESLSAFQDLQTAGAVRHIGVSNFPTRLVEEARQYAPIFCNQVEYHPYLAQEALLKQAKEMDYLLTAYSPVAQGKVLDDPVITDIAGRHDKGPAQVVLRWLIQQPQVCAIPKAASAAHRARNIDIFDFELTPDEMTAVHKLARADRLVDPADGPAWD